MQLPLFRLSFLMLTCVFGINLATAQDRMRIAIPLFPTAAFPLLVASDRGFFQREGLIVEPIRINSAPTTYQALISGDVHGAVGAPTGLLPSYAQGADIITVGSWDNLVPYVWLTKEKINDVRELRGKRIGVNRAGSKPWLIIQVLLQNAGLDPVKDLPLMRGGIDATLADVVVFKSLVRGRIVPGLLATMKSVASAKALTNFFAVERRLAR